MIITVILTMNQVIIIGTLGNSSNYLVYPVLEVVRGIKLGHFIERLDTLYVLGIITTLFLKISIFHYCLISTIQHIAKVTSNRLLIWPATLIVFVGAMYLFKTSGDLMQYMLYVAPAFFVLTLVAIPLCAVLVQQIKTKMSAAKRS